MLPGHFDMQKTPLCMQDAPECKALPTASTPASFRHPSQTGPPQPPITSVRSRIRNSEFVWEQGLGHRFWVSTSAFYNMMNGLITEEPIPAGLIFRNLQNVKSTGLEGEIKAQFASGLEGTVNYSFNRPRIGPQSSS